MTDIQQIADDLEAAAELLETEKFAWCQGSLGHIMDDNTPQLLSVCAVGALAAVIAGDDLLARTIWRKNTSIVYSAGSELGKRIEHARRVVNYYLNAHSDSVEVEIEPWNDADNRTREEVVELFKNTAKDLRNNSGGES